VSVFMRRGAGGVCIHVVLVIGSRKVAMQVLFLSMIAYLLFPIAASSSACMDRCV
jgi:hypothetical protein